MRAIPLTPEIQKCITDAIAAGNTRHDAADYAGICDKTLRRWLARGRKASRGPHRALLSAVKKAEADAVVRNVAIIQKAAQKTWQAAAWWLERKRGEDWGQLRDAFRQLSKEFAELKDELREQAAARGPAGAGQPASNGAP